MIFRNQTPGAIICPPTTSQAAAKLYQTIRYPQLDVCQKACSQMELRTINIARENEWKYDGVKLMFRNQITVSREVLSYTLLSLVAEVGFN